MNEVLIGMDRLCWREIMNEVLIEFVDRLCWEEIMNEVLIGMDRLCWRR